MSSPPTYEATLQADAQKAVTNAELLTLELQGEFIVAQHSNDILFELSQAPLLGGGAAFSIERIVYRSVSSESTPQLRRRKKHIYDVKDIIFTHPTMKPMNMLGLQSIAGPNTCIKGGAAIVKGKRLRFCPCIRVGESWHVETSFKGPSFMSMFHTKDGIEFRGQDKALLATATARTDDSPYPRLELKAPLDGLMLNTLVALWCASMWYRARQVKLYQNLQAYKQFREYSNQSLRTLIQLLIGVPRALLFQGEIEKTDSSLRV